MVSQHDEALHPNDGPDSLKPASEDDPFQPVPQTADPEDPPPDPPPG